MLRRQPWTAARREVTTQRLERLDNDSIVLTLEPTNPRAAPLSVAAHDLDIWVFSAGQTWHYVERYPGDVEDRHAELAQVAMTTHSSGLFWGPSHPKESSEGN
jgi:hypothetical protein